MPSERQWKVFAFGLEYDNEGQGLNLPVFRCDKNKLCIYVIGAVKPNFFDGVLYEKTANVWLVCIFQELRGVRENMFVHLSMFYHYNTFQSNFRT